jgi:hypothetical protein
MYQMWMSIESEKLSKEAHKNARTEAVVSCSCPRKPYGMFFISSWS